MKNLKYNAVTLNFIVKILQDGETKYLLNKTEITREAFDRMPDDKKKEVEMLTSRLFEQRPDDEKKKYKLQVKFSKPAKVQLDLDLQALSCLLKMIGLKKLPPIKRMAAGPEELTDNELKKNLSSDGIQFFRADPAALEENSKLIEKVFLAADVTFQFQEEDYKRLIAALVFLSSFEKKGVTESAMKLATQEGEAGRQFSQNFEKQLAVKTFVEKALPESKTEVGTVVVWLDPIQLEILNDVTTKKQIIIGPASTGKTLLIQLKVLQIIEKSTVNVLIILPCKQLEAKYKDFFLKTDLDTSTRIEFVTPDTQYWESLLEENKTSHWFIDEFAALNTGHHDFCSHVLDRTR